MEVQNFSELAYELVEADGMEEIDKILTEQFDEL
jgi:hypothetical protein